MGTLEGSTPAVTFKDLLQVSNSNNGIDATVRAVEDGEGTVSPLQLSTAVVNIQSGFQLAGVAVSVTAAEINVLDAATLTDGGLVIGKGTGPLESTGVLGDGAVVVGDGTTNPVLLTLLTSSTGQVTHERGGIEIDISAITTDEFLGGTALGVIGIRTPAQVRTSLGLVIDTDVQADLDVPSQAEAEAGTATIERVWTAQRVGQAGAPSFAAGTLMLFQQTAAPTGWTKETTHNNKALRIVSGTAGSAGATAFTTVFGSGKVTGNHTLTTSEMPSHDHTQRHFSGGSGGPSSAGDANSSPTTSGEPTTATRGGGGSHNHTLSLDLQYVDVIIASKD